MRAQTTLFRWMSVVVALVGLAACGLIKSDILTLTFDLPSKSFSFDTASAMWKAPPGNFPAVPCGPAQVVTDCCHPPAGAQPDCVATPLACVGGFCALEFPVSIVQKIDLKNEVPALANQNGQSLADISIKQIQYMIVSTMNVELPPIEIFIAPDGVTSASDPAAQKFGTVPATPAGATQSGDVVLDPNGGAAFTQHAKQFTTPFNLIATTTMVVVSGSPPPSGRADITVTGKVSAKPNL